MDNNFMLGNEKQVWKQLFNGHEITLHQDGKRHMGWQSIIDHTTGSSYYKNMEGDIYGPFGYHGCTYFIDGYPFAYVSLLNHIDGKDKGYMDLIGNVTTTETQLGKDLLKYYNNEISAYDLDDAYYEDEKLLSFVRRHERELYLQAVEHTPPSEYTRLLKETKDKAEYISLKAFEGYKARQARLADDAKKQAAIKQAEFLF